ncbi:MAG: MgtC/SapB family protein [Lachnospiraceae bacterium]|jgi:putative Mg2+ transporter-C (MgtC) family protein|nr:MgtC/SapB family protein [Lachnospiraceae bacterium]MCR5320416.1 MgtC/SapB family protein [Lachnospiraceae bacterium]
MTAIEILEFLQSPCEVAVVIRLALAALFGALIGWERIARHHNAGIRTFALVSLGSAVAAALNIYLALMPELKADASRISAQVVSGIGFLGAGTILVTGRKQIKGLSTAASLWVSACMGMAIGAGYLVVGVACFFMVIFANMVLLHLSRRVEGNSKYLSIYIEVDKARGVTKLMKKISEEGFNISSMVKSKEKTLLATDCGLIIDLDLDRRRSHSQVLDIFSNQDYVNYIEEV